MSTVDVHVRFVLLSLARHSRLLVIVVVVATPVVLPVDLSTRRHSQSIVALNPTPCRSEKSHGRADEHAIEIHLDVAQCQQAHRKVLEVMEEDVRGDVEGRWNAVAFRFEVVGVVRVTVEVEIVILAQLVRERNCRQLIRLLPVLILISLGNRPTRGRLDIWLVRITLVVVIKSGFFICRVVEVDVGLRAAAARVRIVVIGIELSTVDVLNVEIRRLVVLSRLRSLLPNWHLTRKRRVQFVVRLSQPNNVMEAICVGVEGFITRILLWTLIAAG